MHKIIIAAAIVGLSSAVAFAQGGGGGGSGGSGSAGAGAGMSSGGAGGPAAPHRQPRRSSFNNESTGTGAGSIYQVDPADAALDRKIKSICRGC